MPKTSDCEAAAERAATYQRQRDAYFAERAKIERAEGIARRWRQADVPGRHAGAADLRHTGRGPWLDRYRSLAERLESGVLAALLGPRGTGKTQLAVCLIREACELGLTARYIKAMDLFAALRQAMHDGREGDEHRRWRGLGLLVIDEAHERGHTDYEDRSLVNLIDHRYDAMRATVLISNQTREAFAQTVGASIVSRIHECGEAVVCDWPSFRRQP